MRRVVAIIFAVSVLLPSARRRTVARRPGAAPASCRTMEESLAAFSTDAGTAIGPASLSRAAPSTAGRRSTANGIPQLTFFATRTEGLTRDGKRLIGSQSVGPPVSPSRFLP